MGNQLSGEDERTRGGGRHENAHLLAQYFHIVPVVYDDDDDRIILEQNKFMLSVTLHTHDRLAVGVDFASHLSRSKCSKIRGIFAASLFIETRETSN